MIARSTTFRFAALVFLFQIIAAAVLLAGLGLILRKQIAADAADTAEVLRGDLLTTYRQGGERALRSAIEMQTSLTITPGAVMLLTDRQGRRLAGNLSGWSGHGGSTVGYADIDVVRLSHLTDETARARVTRLAGGETLVTGVVVEGEHRVLDMLARVSLVALLLALGFAAVAAWLAARLIVRRLDATVATLGAVREGDLARRVPADPSGDAFALLGAEVNRALDRVEALVGELKIATDGMAHDLKSPLTRLRVALDRAAAEVSEPTAQDAIDRAVAEGDRLLAMVETALSISRAEGGIGRESFVAADLAEIIETMAEIYAPLAEELGRTIVVDSGGGAIRPVHRELLAQALGNLIDNALKYGAGTITLSLDAAHDATWLRVRDEGPGIPAGRRAEALRRFGRLDEARSGSGAGLGLSLVAAVARLHDGIVELGDAAPGLVVSIRLA